MILVGNYNDNDEEYWKNNWRSQAPESIRCFIWLLSCDGLLTNRKKNCKGLESAMWNYYGDVEKDTLQVLRVCPLAMTIWLTVVHTNMRTTFFTWTIIWVGMQMVTRRCSGLTLAIIFGVGIIKSSMMKISLDLFVRWLIQTCWWRIMGMQN